MKLYLLSGFDAFVCVVRERCAGNKAARAGGDIQFAVLQNDLPLTDDQHGRSSQLHPLQHIILRCLTVNIKSLYDIKLLSVVSFITCLRPQPETSA